MPEQPALVALLEGVSDVAAVRAALTTAGVDLTKVELVDLQGVTNVGRVLAEIRQLRPEAEVVGMCDAGEVRHVMTALAADGCPATDASDLPAYGFFVCEPDLEDELLRALGTPRAVEAIRRSPLGGKLQALQVQPAWRDLELDEQLRRFTRTPAARKERVAGVLAEALTREELPEPIAMLVDRISWSV
ncbi:hypothetical protein [Arsenicicoccus dermatophilus]|uniref:hypothetical protein n=1 Tax=Arsenicicoccus dermatophilus TaxID=1076331 RepID=UPI001F4C7B2B|nr:hypothetical protein [Arsenicicoccus dermatophilus]MCH8613220.1 hypothetical protein [Arsenicicoccus dermatophilus]